MLQIRQGLNSEGLQSTSAAGTGCLAQLFEGGVEEKVFCGEGEGCKKSASSGGILLQQATA